MFDYINRFSAWVEDNPDKVDPYITSVYFTLLIRANRVNWKEKFVIILIDLQETCGINSRTTMLKTLTRLEDYGFIKTISYTTNQYKNRVICLPLNEKHVKSTWKANGKHVDSTWTHNKTIKDSLDYKDLKSNVPVEPKKKKPTKINFSESEVFDKSIFVELWQQTETGRRYPNINPERVYEHMKLSGSEYKYADWMAAAQKWVNSNPNSPQWNNVKQQTQLLPDEFTSPANEASARFRRQARAAILGAAQARGKLNSQPKTD